MDSIRVNRSELVGKAQNDTAVLEALISVHLGANLPLLRPFQVIPNMTFSISEPHFVLQISQPPNIAQKRFCTQNLHIWVSFFRRKKRLRNP